MKLLTATVFAVAALGVAPLAQAGIGVPQGPSAKAGVGVPQGIGVPGGSAQADYAPGPGIIGVL